MAFINAIHLHDLIIILNFRNLKSVPAFGTAVALETNQKPITLKQKPIKTKGDVMLITDSQYNAVYGKVEE